MGIRTSEEVAVGAFDIPKSAAVLQEVAKKTVDIGVTNYFMTNRLTFFEELVIAITDGYAASGREFPTSEAFAQEACKLARMIAYERDKYVNL
jgi:hypothetical protein